MPAAHSIEITIDTGNDTHETQALQPPLGANAAVSEPQHGRDAVPAPSPPQSTPTAVKSFDAMRETPTVPVRWARQNPLRQGARALLEAWEDSASADALDEYFATLHAALAMEVSASPLTEHPRPPRDTKRTQILAMLRRREGASGPQIAEAMGWAPHTVRGFLAGLAKKGTRVDVLQRVRQVGPDKTGAKGSFTVYRVVETPQP
jgi:hypothetical protein